MKKIIIGRCKPYEKISLMQSTTLRDKKSPQIVMILLWAFLSTSNHYKPYLTTFYFDLHLTPRT